MSNLHEDKSNSQELQRKDSIDNNITDENRELSEFFL
jgi:hypothetical protein